MPSRLTEDAAAIAASNLVRAVIDAQAGAGLLEGLSREGAPMEVDDLYVEMLAVVRREAAKPRLPEHE